ncbi:MAG TPA: hypothetical protein ENJ37_03235 [Deltaproteobacteria bacterium]|nr:hypothetical protein [Deltaproteobacteria bacterium]
MSAETKKPKATSTAGKKTKAAEKPAKKPSGAATSRTGARKQAARGAAAPRSARKARTKGKPSFTEEMIARLEAEKQQILQEVAQKMRSESDTHKFEIGDIYDIASSERERELALTLGNRDREKIAEIEDALERLRDGTYGDCEECGEPITEGRLRVMPFTRLCVECKSRDERLRHVRGRHEEETGLGIIERSELEEEEF